MGARYVNSLAEPLTEVAKSIPNVKTKALLKGGPLRRCVDISLMFKSINYRQIVIASENYSNSV